MCTFGDALDRTLTRLSSARTSDPGVKTSGLRIKVLLLHVHCIPLINKTIPAEVSRVQTRDDNFYHYILTRRVRLRQCSVCDLLIFVLQFQSSGGRSGAGLTEGRGPLCNAAEVMLFVTPWRHFEQTNWRRRRRWKSVGHQMFSSTLQMENNPFGTQVVTLADSLYVALLPPTSQTFC